MGEQLRISGVVPESIVDGRGFRFTIFTQGCPHHCPGCHNPQTHDFSGGKLVDTDWLFQELKKDPLLKGVTFSGGEPFCQPGILARLAQRIHQQTKLDVTVYTASRWRKCMCSRRLSWVWGCRIRILPPC